MIVDVAVPYPLPKSFHYWIEPEMAESIVRGSLIKVPFGGKRTTHGYVLGFPKDSQVAENKLKSVDSVLVPEPLFSEKMFGFLEWVSRYYCHPLGEVLSTAIPKQCWEYKTKKRIAAHQPLETDADLFQERSRPTLNEEQQKAVDALLGESKLPSLLHGVTGSGKTEVYLTLMESVLAEGKGAIVLVPEISLTPQLLGRFAARFPKKTAVLHSNLTTRERRYQWEAITSGEAQIVIGARSAIFAPMDELGLIVVDEEQETSFKQEDSLRYHARDMAVVRGQLFGARVVLGSATPSLETYANAKKGKYQHLLLKKRVLDRPLPVPTFVDLSESENLYSKKHDWLSQTLVKKMTLALERKEQILLYLNRLGYAHLLYCHDCSHIIRCHNCDVSLTYYRKTSQLRCHYCNASRRPPNLCPECSGTRWEPMGLGTEQVERVLAELFPNARFGRMDRSVVHSRKDLEQILSQITRHEIDIVIGTQMLAKGHDFPDIGLVGVLLADASLNMPDFRANERTYQILTQVSGRAGRAEKRGEVVIQTRVPNHPVLRAAVENRADDFYLMELAARRQFSFPPHTRTALLRFQHSNSDRVRRFAESIVEQLRSRFGLNGIEFLGPSEAPLAKMRRQYRWQCLVKAATRKELDAVLRTTFQWRDKDRWAVQFTVDVDPVNLF